ncbi:MAG: 50S ribosomal protein L29 [Planctomycetota bacterium]
MDASELRDMSDEQLQLTLQETCRNFFKLRLQAQTERLDAPSELKKNRRMIARIKTVQRQREMTAAKEQAAAPAAAE